jgi:hypothetical protein
MGPGARGAVRGQVPAPVATHRMESARTLLLFAEGQMEALAQVLAAPERIPHPEAVLPLLRADLELWTLVKALADAQIAEWSAEGHD